MSALVFTVPTTCSKPSIGVGFNIFSPYSLAWPHLRIFLAQISYVGLLGLFNVHFSIQFLIRHIVSPRWHMGGFSETTYMNGLKLDSTDAG